MSLLSGKLFPAIWETTLPVLYPEKKVTPWQAIELIYQSGGIAVLAHPLLYGLGQEQLRLLFSRLRKAGLDGVEVFYSSNSREEERLSRQLCPNYDLVPSGGSDFHGDNKRNISLVILVRGNLENPRIPFWNSCVNAALSSPHKPPGSRHQKQQ